MKIYVNEKEMSVNEGITSFSLRDLIKKEADVVVLNGFIIKEDVPLKENDRVVFITKGAVPDREELESLLVSRHTPRVHERVEKACIGIAGLGGLGSNVAVALARIGIGKLVLVDYDLVEPSNLNRQHYFLKHIGMKKTRALKEIISEINPFVEVEIRDIYLDKTNMEESFKDVDIIVEAFDNPICKAELVNIALSKLTSKYIVAASGMAGHFSNNTIKTKKIRDKFYLIGDDISEAKPGCGLMAPRVSIAASHQANTVLRIILDEYET
ncbi:thiamine biosynthesis protein ThiF [Anaeromicrobium sediminis]|uniref:Thiamine biosynthesis protein ThiF n=1 Tax=Anaeromicrobium sediminis TaxID=1478221 RepID=A0A267ML36_9FIRM|nr:sulfur carrier protein ThiS adenylyltransferase ThiF [Anaeromicrobium sediminis]PAB59513.1 thiamine biosynthesis protein ThiF [Anaeromicrobium sediminis]